MTILKLTWLDTDMNPGWKSLNDINEDRRVTVCHTVGVLIEKTTDYYRVASSWHEPKNVGDDDCERYADVVTIPYQAVTNVVTLEDDEEIPF